MQPAQRAKQDLFAMVFRSQRCLNKEQAEGALMPFLK